MSVTNGSPAAPRIRSIALSWAAPAAWGAGLIEAAVGAGALVGPSTAIAPRLLGAAMVVLGLAALAWGGCALRTGRLVVPRVAVAAAAAGVLGAGAMMLAVPAHTSVLAVAALLALTLPTAAVVARTTRRPAVLEPVTPSVWMLVAVALLLAILVTPALASVQNSVLIDDLGNLPTIPGHAGH